MADIRVYPYLSPRVIEVLDPADEIAVQEIIDLVRDWEDDEANMAYDFLIDAAGKEPLGGGVSVGITATLQNAQLRFSSRPDELETGTVTTGDSGGITLHDTSGQFETNGIYPGCTVVNNTTTAMETVTNVVSEIELEHFVLGGGSRNDWQVGDSYSVYPNVQCTISGGNLVAVDENGSEISPVLQSPNVQIIRSSSSSATLQELEDVQYASFNGGVSLDPINGDDNNRGNTEFPVKTLARAQAVCVERGFDSIHVFGSLTLQATDDVRNYNLNGQAPNKTYVYVTDGCLTNRVHFNHISVEGDLTGSDGDFRDCFVSDLTGAVGIFRDCYLAGTITLGGTSSDIVTFTNCYLGTSAIGLVEINMNGDGAALAMRPYTGGVRIINKSGSVKVAIDFLSGRLELMDTVTAGTFFIRGVGEITLNEATGITLNDKPLVNPAVVADAAWNEILAEHLTAGTTGKKLYDGGTGDPAEIAAAVWDADKDDYNDPDTMGELQNTGGAGDPAAIADAVWDEASDDHVDSDTMGELQNKIDTITATKPKVIPGE